MATQEGVSQMLKRVLVLTVLVGVVIAPSALAADPTPADFKNAAKYCKAVRESKGVEAFASLYGTNANKKNAYGKCVSTTAKAKVEKREDAAETNAANAECKKQQHADSTKFAQDYENFGQCVKSQKDKSQKDKSQKDKAGDDED
jgi:hypothetical protein